MHRYVLVTCRCYVMLMVGLVRRDLRSGSMVGLVYTPVVFVSV